MIIMMGDRPLPLPLPYIGIVLVKSVIDMCGQLKHFCLHFRENKGMNYGRNLYIG
jgi:hypothetical protein